MRVTAAARIRRRAMRDVTDDSALSSAKVYHDMPRKGSPGVQ